ncbi:hypothetical protein HUX57_11510 [Arcobacter butzleri]|uniref:hypothetical protein n=1 Tax=Aliarcobacter butzleri TaxID=28197 RepID=UPI001587344D|nr:hypothetical protein [Aliarcobacter butzleri]NUW27284.1 hypothetical protein [Aliarcobacter butzleri]
MEMNLKWENNASFKDNEFNNLWDKINKNDDKCMYITGFGFDPRSLKSLEKIVLNKEIFDLVIIKNTKETESPEELNSYHIKKSFISDRNYKDIIHFLHNEILSNRYKHVVIDISAMPRHLYLTLINFIINIIRKYNISNEIKINFYVTVVENPEIDRKIKSIIAENSDAEILSGYQAGYTAENISTSSKIWFPVLGENESERLKKIYEYIRPDEICPIIPSPSHDPRRSDSLIKEYRELLFDTWRIETSNFIYATENNPFDIYKKILDSSKYFSEVFELMLGCRIIISTFSSKLISIGALLAANDLQKNGYNVSIFHVKSTNYKNSNVTSKELSFESSKFTTIQVEGEIYDY